MFDPQEIERLIREKIPASTVAVRDMTGGHDHFEVSVSSAAFVGKSILEQHRLIYSALGDAVGGPIHALQIKTSIPA